MNELFKDMQTKGYISFIKSYEFSDIIKAGLDGDLRHKLKGNLSIDVIDTVPLGIAGIEQSDLNHPLEFEIGNLPKSDNLKDKLNDWRN